MDGGKLHRGAGSGPGCATKLPFAAPFLGYIVSRSVGLPGATDDISNWTQPLGLAALFVEFLVMGISLRALVPVRYDDNPTRTDRLSSVNPPTDVPGMVTLRIDTRGRLVELVAVPHWAL